MRRLHLAFFIALIAMGAVPGSGAAPGSVSGVVRNSAGVPQIGAVIQLLRPDLSVAAEVYTDDRGQYSIASVVPGQYSIKAICRSFLPSMRENLRIRRATVVNLSLSTLYEVMQWLPTQPRSAAAQRDDWEWTLRSAANRPLLRWLEDGPLVVVSDGAGRPRLKARLMATGQQGTFGESGERITAAVENTPSNSRELLARVDFAPNTDAGMESMLGFRQDLGLSGSVQSVAAVAVHPEVEGHGAEGMEEVAVRSWETFHLGDEFEGDAGSEQVLARFSRNSPNTAVAALPFASFGWRNGSGNTMIRYRMTTLMHPLGDDSEAAYYLPAVAATSGSLTVERGVHQEIAWERQTDATQMAVALYTDNVRDPVVEAAAHPPSGSSSLLAADVLYDPASGLMRAAVPGYSSAGLTASVAHRLPAETSICLGYANGDALAMSAAGSPIPLLQVLGSARPRRVQSYTLSLSGTIEGTGTRWRASYRWQPEDTVTQVASFSPTAIEPYLNLHLRQSLSMHHHEGGANGVEALIDVRNMLAQGYRPYVLSDGSVLIFAQDQRSIRAGLAFTF